jgi:hypothetical protein
VRVNPPSHTLLEVIDEVDEINPLVVKESRETCGKLVTKAFLEHPLNFSADRSRKRSREIAEFVANGLASDNASFAPDEPRLHGIDHRYVARNLNAHLLADEFANGVNALRRCSRESDAPGDTV